MNIVRPLSLSAVLLTGALSFGGRTVGPHDREPSGAHRADGRTVLPIAAANDNRRPAGRMRGDTLSVALEVRVARWYPEAEDGPFVDAPMLAEVGRSPQVPGPLIRVREGTVIAATLHNALVDSTVTWIGLASKPGTDTVRVPPGATATIRFVAGQPGSYLYAVRAGDVDHRAREREQLTAAFVIDARGARTDDRIFVMNIWGEPLDSVTYRNALTINGKAWPFTERITATEGDTLRWRVVNGTDRIHPMHLHGFFYRISARGDGARDTLLNRQRQEDVVTQLMEPYSTMQMSYVAAREGNWLFHCHLSFHVSADARFTDGVAHADHVSGDAMRHMAGLVLGLNVKPRPGVLHPARRTARQLRLRVEEGTPRHRAPRLMSAVLQDAARPTADSVRLPGTTLFLTRGEPTDISVVNALNEPTAIHWHGIELESYSDGVAGWSGAMNRLAPMIAPRDSFVARLTLPRAGTFIYHTHLNDVEQLTSGLYGGIVVLEPGTRFDASRDHLFVVGWDGPADPPHLLVNGDSLPAPKELAFGVHHRLRFVFIGAVGGESFALRSASGVVRWRTLARDGFELAPSKQRELPAEITGWAGQTYDFDFLPSARGRYELIIGDPKSPSWTQVYWVR